MMRNHGRDCGVPGVYGGDSAAKEKSMRLLQVILLSCFFLASCETIKGVGRDVEDAGETIDDSIDDE